MAYPDQIRPLLDDAVRDSGALVEDVVITPAGRRSVVRVVLDRRLAPGGESTAPTPPLSLDEIADLTTAVSDALDSTDVLGERAYTLEVTSPGVGRPLTEPRHFRRNVGRLVTLTPLDGAPVSGRVTRAGDTDLTIEVAAAGKQPPRAETHAYAALARAVVEVEFTRAADDGAGEES